MLCHTLVNRYLASLSKLFTVARKEWHWASHNPVSDVSRFEEGERIRWLSEDERKALLAETAKAPDLHTFVLLALSTGCRAGELRRLEWRDVDLTSGRILFRKTKNRQARTVWLHGEGLAALKAHGKVRQLSGHVSPNVGGSRAKRGESLYDYDEPFKAALEAAGIQDFRFHDLRHTAATYLAQAGATHSEPSAAGNRMSSIATCIWPPRMQKRRLSGWRCGSITPPLARIREAGERGASRECAVTTCYVSDFPRSPTTQRAVQLL